MVIKGIGRFFAKYAFLIYKFEQNAKFLIDWNIKN